VSLLVLLLLMMNHQLEAFIILIIRESFDFKVSLRSGLLVVSCAS
jgi:hypothetical protein